MNIISSNRHLLIDRSSPIPTYQQIASDISKRITQKEWNIEDKLPSEMELSKDYDVSRVTLRQAMAQLEKDGIIEKFQGKGAFVKNNPKRLVQDLAFPSLDLNKVTPNPIRSKIIQEEIIAQPDHEICRQLNLQPGTPVIQLQRLHYHQDKPTGLSYLWFASEKVPGLKAQMLVGGSISKTLYHTYHYNITSIDNYIESVKLDAIEASLLNSVYDAPGLKISSHYLLQDETPIEYSSTVWLSDHTRLHYKVSK